MSKNSRLKTVTQGTQTVTLTYDDAGRRTGLTYPNGVVTTYGYDNANRLLSINHIKTPTTIEALTYQNDAAGNRIKLTRANAAASLIPQAVTNTAFDAANEQTRFNSASTNLVYDNNGNLTSFTDASGTTTYTWNARNQLTAISGPSLSASFVYDGLGRRTSKTINSATTGFWYDGADVLAELAGTTPSATYIRSLSIDEPFIRKQSGGDEFYQVDALGTTLALTDGAGSSNTTYTQEPFGKTTKTGSSSNVFQFTGREEDGAGVMYYRARSYHPKLQRFLQEDLLGLAAGDPNLYAYVFNSPLLLRDPSGLLGLEDASDFAAGFGDSLTFGLTSHIRDLTGANGVVDKCGFAYSTGEWTEVGTEVSLMGLSFGLKAAATHMDREFVYAAAAPLKAAYKKAMGATKSTVAHHIQPLFGHPGGRGTLFPTGGLPPWIHSAPWNLQVLSHAEHVQAHRYLRQLETLAVAVVNPFTTSVRALLDYSQGRGCK
ncbi:hypothetical protein DNFV4_00683 [Nitrospira tepida]|uniref:Teneurin-like YD-shell domain-containing protein n=1 Tax=Nitrospira tepida TaxID=2973512 RepID=A0AA86MWA3_9BACT|nr:RHS repeat-associated core domain-containing protein [Nitrospira tepida]CAI4030255.1 hypothetical protein DNFV4_00683 [Nitrospira tepida]